MADSRVIDRIVSVVPVGGWIDHTLTNDRGDVLVLKAQRTGGTAESFPTLVRYEVNGGETNLEEIAAALENHPDFVERRRIWRKGSKGSKVVSDGKHDEKAV